VAVGGKAGGAKGNGPSGGLTTEEEEDDDMDMDDLFQGCVWGALCSLCGCVAVCLCVWQYETRGAYGGLYVSVWLCVCLCVWLFTSIDPSVFLLCLSLAVCVFVLFCVYVDH
jgi:hypothetical protein